MNDIFALLFGSSLLIVCFGIFCILVVEAEKIALENAITKKAARQKGYVFKWWE